MKTSWTDHKATQEWLKTQAIWKDKDMLICGSICFTIGLFFGIFI